MATAGELEAGKLWKLSCSTALPPAPFTASQLAAQLVGPEEMYDASLEDARRDLIAQKIRLEAYDGGDYIKARDRVFPLAHSGVSDRRAKFMNRAGHKLLQVMEHAAMWDAVLTDGPRGSPRRRRSYTFVDICGGPGAFSQALFQATPPKIKATGLGLTLMDKHVGAERGWYPPLLAQRNFSVTFGIDGTGDIYNPTNVECFCSLVAASGGAQLAVADGGFEVPPSQQNIQEALSARIVYSQWYVATRSLTKGGSFVLKLFDTFTTFSRSLLLLSCHCFDEVFISKPLHSRAVNSERYLACVGFRGLPHDWMVYLERVHADGFTASTAPRSLLPDSVVGSDAAFNASLDVSIAAIVKAQIAALGLVLHALANPEPERAAPADDGDEPAEADTAPVEQFWGS
jgi:cap1 methyltransferase